MIASENWGKLIREAVLNQETNMKTSEARLSVPLIFKKHFPRAAKAQICIPERGQQHGAALVFEIAGWSRHVLSYCLIT